MTRRARISMPRSIDNKHTRASKKLRHLTGRAHGRNGVANGVDEEHVGAGRDSFEAWEELAWRRDDVGCETDDTAMKRISPKKKEAKSEELYPFVVA